MKITLDQLATSLGVSRGTVSRALNGKGRMAEETRQRILAAMRAAGYMPDQAARELRKRSGVSIGISYDRHNIGPYFALFWRALGQAASERGVRLIHLSEPVDSYAALPDAVIVHNTRQLQARIDLLERRGARVVVLGRRGDTAYVVPDDTGGACQATRHLLALGHREIVYLGSVSDHRMELDRRAGYRQAMREAGLALRPEYELEGRFTILGGYRGIRRAWEDGLRFTAVFCGGDEMAIGAIGAFEDLGVAVPDEVSVIGFDGMQGMHPGLTSMAQDLDSIAAQAIDLAESLVAGAPARGIVVPVALFEGATTAVVRERTG